MTPRRPRLLLSVLAVLSVIGCSSDPGPVTATDPGSSSTTSAEPTPTAGTSADRSSADEQFPDDLPLDEGIRRDDSDSTVEGPNRRLAGISFSDMCDPDPTVWPGSAVDRVMLAQSGPEYLLQRELLLYETADQAQRSLDGVAEQLDSCPEVVSTTDPYQPGDRRYVRLEPSGGSVLSLGMHYVEGLGGTVWRLERHGRVVLAVASSGEASAESMQPGADTIDRADGPLWSALEAALPPAMLQ